MLEQLKRDWRSVELDARTRAMLEFGETATRAPATATREHVDRLRSQGFSDVEILDVVLTVALFAFVNRVSSLLGVEPPAPRDDRRESQ